MNKGQVQIVAEKVASTVRVLELLRLEYSVAGPVRPKKKGNESPRVVTVLEAGQPILRIYNGVNGYTWANWVSGDQAIGVNSPQTLFTVLSERAQSRRVQARSKRSKKASQFDQG